MQRRGVAEVAARQDDPVGHLPVELLDDLDADRLLAFEAQRVHRVGEVDHALGREALDDLHAAVEVGIQAEHERAVRERLDELRGRDLAARQEHHDREAGGCAVGRERRAGVAGRRTGDGLDLEALLDRLVDHADEHRHAEIFERAGVAVAAELDPQVVEADLLAVAIGPEQVGAALVHRHDAVIGHLRHHPFALAPNAGAVRPRVLAVALVEQPHPRRTTAVAQRFDVVHDLEQTVALRAAVDRARYGEGTWAAGEAAEFGGVRHGAEYSHREPGSANHLPRKHGARGRSPTRCVSLGRSSTHFPE